MIKSDDRKAETRHKIQLGGLIVKAGLATEDKEFILGALLQAAAKRDDPQVRKILIAAGHKAFNA